MTQIVLVLSDHGDFPDEFVKRLADYHGHHHGNVDGTFNWHDALRFATAGVFPKHVLEKHEHCDREMCHTCIGGLALCVICGGAEASLPTACPGVRMSHEDQEAVMCGDKDFIDGVWRKCERVYMLDLRSVKHVPLAANNRPQIDGYEIVYAPGAISEHMNCEWFAEPHGTQGCHICGETKMLPCPVCGPHEAEARARFP